MSKKQKSAAVSAKRNAPPKGFPQPSGRAGGGAPPDDSDESESVRKTENNAEHTNGAWPKSGEASGVDFTKTVTTDDADDERAARRQRLIDQAKRSQESTAQEQAAAQKTHEEFSTREFGDKFLAALLACVIKHPDQIEWHPISAGCWQTVASVTVAISALSLLKEHGIPPTWTAIEQAALSRTRNSDDPEEAKEQIQEYIAQVQTVETERELPFVKSQVAKFLHERRRNEALQEYAEAISKKTDAPVAEKARIALLDVLSGSVSNTTELLDVNRLIAEQEPDADPVFHGLIERGDVVNFGAASKSYKTWLTLALALSVATGKQWMKKFDCDQGRVVYVNFELKPGKLRKRIEDICLALGIGTPKPGQFQVLNLRGKDKKAEDLVTSLICKLRTQEVALIIIDPLYMLHGNRSENAAEEMASLMKLFGRLAEELNCAVWISHHFSKGDQSGKESIDRFSGSGVFGRYADTLITMTRHQEDDCFVLDFTLRGQKPVEPFVIRWAYPLFEPEIKLDPTKLRQRKRGGSDKDFGVDDILGHLDGKMSHREWFGIVSSATAMSESTFKRRRKEAVEAGMVKQTKSGGWAKTTSSVKTPIDSLIRKV